MFSASRILGLVSYLEMRILEPLFVYGSTGVLVCFVAFCFTLLAAFAGIVHVGSAALLGVATLACLGFVAIIALIAIAGSKLVCSRMMTRRLGRELVEELPERWRG